MTLGEARRRLAGLFLDADTGSPKFAEMVSEVLERFHFDGTWKGGTGFFEFSVSDAGTITLPLWLEAVLLSQFSDRPRPVLSRHYEFLSHGPGHIDPLTSGLGVLVDAGVVATEHEFPSTPGTITIASGAADDGKTIRIFGLDSNGRELYGTDGLPGELVTLASPSVSTVATFSAVLGIQKERTLGYVQVSHADTTELCDIPPAVTAPVYRRYKVAHAAAAGQTRYIRALCSRRALPVSNEEDYIIPGNLAALKMGLYSIQYEETNDMDRSMQYWLRSIDFLNKEADRYRGGAITLPTVQPPRFGLGKIRRTL